MSWAVLVDPLFQVPFAAGAAITLALSLLGALLRLRDEWLAALGLAHLAGASGLAGLALGLPAVVGAPLGAVAGALAKAFGRYRGNAVYALMILIGWSATLLVAANTALGSALGHALVEGQLYFAGKLHLAIALALLGVIALVLPRMAPRLIHARLFPGSATASRGADWRWGSGFDVLVALGMALGTGIFGLMAAFALVFVPPWLAFRQACSWRQCVRITLWVGSSCYLLAFVLALSLDQPFGPVLVVVAVAVVVVGELRRFALRPMVAGKNKRSH